MDERAVKRKYRRNAVIYDRLVARTAVTTQGTAWRPILLGETGSACGAKPHAPRHLLLHRATPAVTRTLVPPYWEVGQNPR